MEWITAVETAYGLEDADVAWLERLLSRLSVLDGGLGLVAQVFSIGTGPKPSLRACATFGGYQGLAAHVERMSELWPPSLPPSLAPVGRAASLRLTLRSLAPENEALFVDAFRAMGAKGQDVLFVPVSDGEGELVVLCAARGEVGSRMPHPARLRRLATHVGAAWRLRRRLREQSAEPRAVVRPSGALVDVTGPPLPLRAELLGAVRDRERARGRTCRRDPDEALSLWRGLAAGRWSLVDRVETGEPRYVLAYDNDPQSPNRSTGLSRREQQVTELLAVGSSLKEAAYDLGLSTSAVGKAALRAREKLGVSSLGELASLAALGARTASDASTPVTASLEIARLEATGASLTSAEREVAVAMLRGRSNADIAAARACSVRTVANLVQRVFRKVGVRSRTELSIRLATT